MSTIVVTPPAAAARVAVAKPSHSVRPGSLTCTWVSTRYLVLAEHDLLLRVEGRVDRRDGDDAAPATADSGGLLGAGNDGSLRAEDQVERHRAAQSSRSAIFSPMPCSNGPGL